MSYTMPLIFSPFGRSKWVNAKGNTECVEFVRQVTGAPATRFWRPGLRVRHAFPGQIKPLTAIATFVGGAYPTDDQGRHAALYLTHDATGIRVLDQWNKQGEVKERVIRFNRKAGTSRSDDGDTFYVIE